MNKQTQPNEIEKLERRRKLIKVLNLNNTIEQAKKRERMVSRLRIKSVRERILKPKRKDRDEIVARQKKFRAPVRAEG